MLLDLVAPDLEALVCGRLLHQRQGNRIPRGFHCRNEAAPVSYRRADTKPVQCNEKSRTQTMTMNNAMKYNEQRTKYTDP